MQGMFKANGGCGYVKKPDFLMKIGPNGQVYYPKEKEPVEKTLKVREAVKAEEICSTVQILFVSNSCYFTQVKVYMGDGWHLDFKQTHFDMYSPPDFYTRVSCLSHFSLLNHLEQLIIYHIHLKLRLTVYTSPRSFTHGLKIHSVWRNLLVMKIVEEFVFIEHSLKMLVLRTVANDKSPFSLCFLYAG